MIMVIDFLVIGSMIDRWSWFAVKTSLSIYHRATKTDTAIKSRSSVGKKVIYTNKFTLYSNYSEVIKAVRLS